MKKRPVLSNDAVEMDDVQILQTDPDRFFESHKRIPFGFVFASGKTKSSNENQ